MLELQEKDNPLYLNQGVVAINYKRNKINKIHNLLKRQEQSTTFTSIGNQITSPKYKFTSQMSLNKSKSSGNLFNNSSIFLNNSNISNNSNLNPSFISKLNISNESKNDDSSYFKFLSYNDIKRGLVDFSDIKRERRFPLIGDYFSKIKLTTNSDDYIPLVKEYKNNEFHMFYNDKEKEIFEKNHKNLGRLKEKKLTVKEIMKNMQKISQRNIEKFRQRESNRYRQIQINLDATIDKSLEKCNEQVKGYFTMMDNCTQLIQKLRKMFFFYSFNVFKNIYYDEVDKYL